MASEGSKPDESYEKVGEVVSIFVRNKRWYANYQWEGEQIRRSLKTTSKKEARRKALLIDRALLSGEHKRQRKSPLISDVTDQYLQHLRSEGRAEKTVRKYEFCYGLLLDIAERRNVTRISQLDIRVVDQYRAERKAGGADRRQAKPKTIHNDTVTIRQLVNFALKRGLISDDPLQDLEIKKPKRTPQPCWTRDQVDRILAAATPPHQAPLVFLAETGARVGEAKWLTWEDVDFERRLIHIRAKAGWKPKSGDERVVPMSDRVFDLLSALPHTSNWVFTARVTQRHPIVGRQISERRQLDYLKRLLKRLGLKGHLHTFRHSFISFAANSGVAERVLRKWIGHVDREVLDWYYHLADPESQAAMKRLSDAAKRGQQNGSTDSSSAQSQHKPRGGQNDESAK
jgi:integrase